MVGRDRMKQEQFNCIPLQMKTLISRMKRPEDWWLNKKRVPKGSQEEHIFYLEIVLFYYKLKRLILSSSNGESIWRVNGLSGDCCYRCW